MRYLGIDGGGSGCRAAVSDATGRILGEGRAGPANITSDPHGAHANIVAAAAAALPTGSDPAQIVAVMGLAGANQPQSVARLAGGLRYARLRVETDAVIAVKGALHEADGIVAAIGTGSVFAEQHSGELRQVGGWGLVLGDEGSGAWIGRAIMAHSLRAVDGFVPVTPLTTALCAEMGGTGGIVGFASRAMPSDFAALAPRVAASDDPAARAVMAAADVQIAAAVDLLQNGRVLPVVLSGGLGPLFAKRLAGRWPIVPPLGRAVDGALWLARRLI